MNKPGTIELVEITDGLGYVVINNKRCCDYGVQYGGADSILSILRTWQLMPSDVLFRAIPEHVIMQYPELRDALLVSKHGDEIDLSEIDRMYQ